MHSLKSHYSSISTVDIRSNGAIYSRRNSLAHMCMTYYYSQLSENLVQAILFEVTSNGAVRTKRETFSITHDCLEYRHRLGCLLDPITYLCVINPEFDRRLGIHKRKMNFEFDSASIDAYFSAVIRGTFDSTS